MNLNRERSLIFYKFDRVYSSSLLLMPHRHNEKIIRNVDFSIQNIRILIKKWSSIQITFIFFGVGFWKSHISLEYLPFGHIKWILSKMEWKKSMSSILFETLQNDWVQIEIWHLKPLFGQIFDKLCESVHNTSYKKRKK